MIKRVALLLGLFFIWGSVLAVAQTIPAPRGFVNDFADILSPTDEAALEETLREYQRNTSIEVAVVTVPSLEGYSVEEYTLRLANQWGVGDAQKDNGVVFLTAPQERRTRIEVGYGMEPDLTDGRTGRILDESVIPHFREGDMAAGVISGTHAIIESLGSTPFETRLEERRIAEEERRRRDEEAVAALKNFFLALLMFGIPSALLVWLVIVIGRSVKKRQALKALFTSQQTQYQTLSSLTSLWEKLQRASLVLAEIRNSYPEEVWGGASRDLTNAGLLYHSIQDELLVIWEGLQKDNGWKDAMSIQKRMENVSSNQATVDNACSAAHHLNDNLKEAEQRVPELLQTLRTLLPVKVKEVSNEPDALRKTRNELELAQVRYKEVCQNQTLNILTKFAILASVLEIAQGISKRLAEDRERVENARTGLTQIEKKIAEAETNAESETSRSHVSTTAKNLVSTAKSELNRARAHSVKSPDDVVEKYALYAAVLALLSKASSQAKNDVRSYRRRSSYSSYSSHSSSGSSPFRGFGGGGFGGGGASRGW